MIGNFLKVLFGGNSDEQAKPVEAEKVSSEKSEEKADPKKKNDTPVDPRFCATVQAKQEPDDLCKFVDYLVRNLVDAPDEVNIECDCSDPSARHMRIHCAKADVGKVVGKRGKTIIAIRSLVNGAAGRIQQRITLEVAD